MARPKTPKCRNCKTRGMQQIATRRKDATTAIETWRCPTCGFTRERDGYDPVGSVSFTAPAGRDVQRVGGRRPAAKRWRTRGATSPIVIKRLAEADDRQAGEAAQ